MKTKSLFLIILFALGTGMPCSAQRERPEDLNGNYRAPDMMNGKTVLLPVGTTFEGRMQETIGSASSRQGQKFEIMMATAVLANGTDVIIPAGSTVVGEVVEAIPSHHLPHHKGYPKPLGKLRVSLTGLRTPDGVTYPLIASLAPEMTGQHKLNPNLGGGVGYVGSQAAFTAVQPGMADRNRQNGYRQPPRVMTRSDLQRDPIYGGDNNDKNYDPKAQIRSLMRHGNDLVILSGSPVSVRVDAPFKIGMSSAPGAEASFEAATERAQTGGGRRFAPMDAAPPPQNRQNPQAEQGGNPSGLPFLQPKGSLPFENSAAPQGAPNAMPQQNAPPSNNF